MQKHLTMVCLCGINMKINNPIPKEIRKEMKKLDNLIEKLKEKNIINQTEVDAIKEKKK